MDINNGMGSKHMDLIRKEKGYPLHFRKDVVDLHSLDAIHRISKVNIDPYIDGYTRSGGTLEALVEGVFKYDRPQTFKPDAELWARAFAITRRAFLLPQKVKVLWVKEVETWKRETSAGYSFPGQRKESAYPEALRLASRYESLARQGRRLYNLAPCMTFMRTQLSTTDKPKVRAVWGYPFEVTLLEGKFAEPLVLAYKATANSSPMFIGPRSEGRLRLFLSDLQWHRHQVALDWSGFDSSISVPIINQAFRILEENLDMSEREKRVWEEVKRYFINTSIKTPNGLVLRKHMGIPSGSFFTQLIGSVANHLVITYLCLFDLGYAPKIRVLGDDSAFGSSVVPNLASWEKEALRAFGMTLSASKSEVVSDGSSRSVTFLGKWVQSSELQRDETKLLRLLVYPERPVYDIAESAMRAWSLYLDSGMRSWAALRTYEFLRIESGLRVRRSLDMERRFEHGAGVEFVPPEARVVTSRERVSPNGYLTG